MTAAVDARHRRLGSQRTCGGDRAGARRERRCTSRSARRHRRRHAHRGAHAARASCTMSAPVATRWACCRRVFRTLPLERARLALDPSAGLGRASARRRARRAPAPLARRHRRATSGRTRAAYQRTLRAVPRAVRTSCSPTCWGRCACRAIRCGWRASACRGCCPRPRLSALRASRARARRRCWPAAPPIRSFRSSGRSPRRSRCSSPSPGTSRTGRLPKAVRRPSRERSPRCLHALGRTHRDRPPHPHRRRPAAGARRAVRHQPGATRRHLRRRSCRRAMCAVCAAIRYGPGVFKLDWALDGPIPWRDPRCLDAVDRARRRHARRDRRRRGRGVARASTRSGRSCMVVQQSQFDPTRAPAGSTPATRIATSRPGRRSTARDAIERQIERFAPGFRERILARHAMTTADFATRQSKLRRRRDHRRGGGPVPVLHAAGCAARSVLDAEPAALPVLGVDAAGRRRARHVRLLRGAQCPRAPFVRPVRRRTVIRLPIPTANGVRLSPQRRHA